MSGWPPGWEPKTQTPRRKKHHHHHGKDVPPGALRELIEKLIKLLQHFKPKPPHPEHPNKEPK